MTIRDSFEKPKVDIEALISKGLQITEEDKSPFDKTRKHIRLGIPVDLLNQIDERVKNRVGISRTGWILEAIDEKLKSLENINE